MDQSKTGAFIAALRREHSLTQRQLADRLSISDKTVSKWETGKGLPEVSLMLPLCEILHITVNELLSGQRLADSDYQEKTEEIIMDLVLEREESKKKLTLSAIVCGLGVLAGVTLVLTSGLAALETWARAVLIAVAMIVMFGCIGVACTLEIGAGTFECCHCRTRFVPTAGAYIAGMHTLTTRWLKCPQCGRKSFCRRRLTH